MGQRSLFGGKVVEIPIAVHQDHRGVLTPIQFTDYGFQPVRAFVVTAPRGAIRGGHAHRTGRQLLMQVSGEIGIELRYQDQAEYVLLDAVHRALLVPAPVWSRQTYLGDKPTMIVFCDTAFDPNDYFSTADAD